MNKSDFSKQKSLGSSNILNNAELNPLEKKNSRTQSTKFIFKSDVIPTGQNNKIIASIGASVKETRRSKSNMFNSLYNDPEEKMMKSSFTRAEIEAIKEEDLAMTTSIDVNQKITTGNSEYKLLMKNEFSNNIRDTWYLSKDLKKSLKNQEKSMKKRRCMGCKAFKIDTKACQCKIF